MKLSAFICHNAIVDTMLMNQYLFFQNTVTLASEDLLEAEEWIIQIQKAIYSIHCQVTNIACATYNVCPFAKKSLSNNTTFLLKNFSPALGFEPPTLNQGDRLKL